MEKFARLPVWPAWNGAFLWLIGNVLGYNNAAKVEDAITGRVCPNFYNYRETSPFIMLVHHCHSFAVWDPLRFCQRTFFPEGFPAHPHRGFVTITYIMHGGFVHRDSQGVKQAYGAEVARHGQKHTQWLTTGRGMLHEEMFDIADGNSRQELYQIWLNVPAQYKMDEPRSILLGASDETPVVEDSTSKTLILAGRYRDRIAASPTVTDLALFHVTLQPGITWSHPLPATYETAFVYLRKGSLFTDTSNAVSEISMVPVHHTAYFDTTSGDSITVAAGPDGADFMFLAGVPIPEPCVASGSMVMTSDREIEQAYADYQMGKFGLPWDHNLSDGEWAQHVQRNGPRP